MAQPQGAMPMSDAPIGIQAPPQAPQQLVDPGQLPPRTDGFQLNQQAMRDLYVLDPEAANAIQTFVFNGQRHELEAAQRRGEGMYRVAATLQSIPEAERPAAFQRMIPQLQQMGIPVEDLSGVDLSDRGLRQYANFGMTLSALDQSRQPVRAGPGDVFLSPNDYSTVIGGSPEPRLVTGADGSIVPLYPSWNQPQGGGSALPPGFVRDGGPTQPASGGFSR